MLGGGVGCGAQYFIGYPCLTHHVSVCIKTFGDKLTLFEHSEILDYSEIWYLGSNASKIEGTPGSPCNNGNK